MLDKSSPIYIDVREPYEFQDSHINGALNIPVGSISSTTQLGLPKDAKIILYCRSGHRAGIAKQQLEAMGYTKVVNGINQETIQASSDNS